MWNRKNRGTAKIDDAMPHDPERLNPELLKIQLGQLLRNGAASLSGMDLTASELSALGFDVDVRGDRVSIPPHVERLDAAAIEAALSEQARTWLSDLKTLELVGSTNTLLGELAAAGAAHGAVRIAELQVQGRGRRGRAWQSPYGQNLALSLGVRLPVKPDALSGFSLCTGLAVADALHSAGVEGIALKWPNDVLIDGRKIGGILVEIHGSGHETDVIVGIGINFRIPETARRQIEQPLIDLQELGGGFSRNEIAGRLISSLVDFAEGFSVGGFLPMREAFNRLHCYHDRACVLLMGEERIAGIVRGVTGSGELELEIDGRLQAFSAGEVSLRAG